MITEDFVSFETAKLLKDKGFETDDCHTAYDENGEFFLHGDYSKDRHGIVDAPTLQMAMKWLREIHNIIIVPTQYHKYMKKKVCDEFYYGCLIFKLNTDCPLSNDNFLNKKYEKSCDSAIKYCLENLI